MRQEYQRSQRSPAGHRSSVLSSGMMLLGGAGIGAAVMYLLDPEAGERRREEMRLRAAHAASTTGTVLGNVADIAGNVAGNVWDMTTEAGRAMAHRAAEAGSAGAAAASGYGSSLAERAAGTAHGLRKGARHQMRAARHTASGWFGHEEESHLPSTGTALSAVTALATGVGMMYFLDPTDGARRRALVGQKATHWLNEAGDLFRKTGRHLANRSRGMAHEARGVFQREPGATDRQVVERLRSRIGHLQQAGSDINVACLDGRVTITGRCSPDHVQSLLSTVQGTPGVSSIVNLLDVQSASASPSTTV